MYRFTCLLLFPALCLANVDVAPLSSGGVEDVFVSWIDGNGAARLGRYAGGILVAETSFGERGTASLGVCRDGSGEPFLMLALASTDFPEHDTLYLLDPLTLDSLDIGSPSMDMMSERAQCGLLRHHDPARGGMMAGFRYSNFSSGNEFYWYMQDYSITGGEIVNGPLQDLFDPYPDADDREVFYHRMVGPVTYGDCRALMATDRHIGGGFGWPGNVTLMTLVRDPAGGDSLNLLSDTLCSVPDTLPADPMVMALGSCSDMAILLWADEWGDVMYSDYNCSSPTPASTQSYQWSLPGYGSPSAMSCDPGDAGLLLVWHSPGEIRCRHYLDGWNDYDRVLWSGAGTVMEGNIAVCSVEDGYWVAWYGPGTDAEYPLLQFVPRDSVTAIENTATGPVPVELTLRPNPFSDALHIELERTGGILESRIYDLSGHMVDRLQIHGGSATWLPDTDLPSGTYIVTVSAPDGSPGSRVVVLLD